MFIAALFIVGRRWKTTTCPSLGAWVNKGLSNTTEYSSAIKRNEVLIHATTWMDLADIVLSERSPSQRSAHCMIPFTKMPRISKPIETESGGCLRLGGVGVC